MLLAHAKAWHTYDQVFRATQQGKVSITLNVKWGEPKRDKQADKDAAHRSIEWFLGWFANLVPRAFPLKVALGTRLVVRQSSVCQWRLA